MARVLRFHKVVQASQLSVACWTIAVAGVRQSAASGTRGSGYSWFWWTRARSRSREASQAFSVASVPHDMVLDVTAGDDAFHAGSVGLHDADVVGADGVVEASEDDTAAVGRVVGLEAVQLKGRREELRRLSTGRIYGPDAVDRVREVLLILDVVNDPGRPETIGGAQPCAATL